MEPPRVVTKFGIDWYRQPDSPRRNDRVYYKSCLGGFPKYLHREIWRRARGPIPEGHHVHHRNGDPFDNRLSNLECISGAQHLSEHATERARRDPEGLRRSLELARPKAAEWHASPEGREWHRKNGVEVMRKRPLVECRCDVCGKAFRSKWPKARVCGNNCHARKRRASGVDDVDRTCVVCAGVFRINKYNTKQLVCSRACSRLRGKR